MFQRSSWFTALVREILSTRFLELHLELFVQFEFAQIPPCSHNDGKSKSRSRNASRNQKLS